MNTECFLNPEDKIVQDGIETLDNIVLSQFEEEVDDDDIALLPDIPLVSINNTIKALETLYLYEEQQEEGSAQMISNLYRHKRVIQTRKLNTQKQRDIRSFFK
jgi:hypothetical protein